MNIVTIIIEMKRTRNLEESWSQKVMKATDLDESLYVETELDYSVRDKSFTEH